MRVQAKLIQRNLSTVSEPRDTKPSLVDQTYGLLKWLCNYIVPDNTTTTGEKFWQ